MSELTVGVAIALPTPHSTVLNRWRQQVGDPVADRVFPHVTLLPPTVVEGATLPAIEDHLRDAASAAEPFGMHLSGTGTFRPTSPVVFVQVAAGVSQCEELESAIRRGPLERPLDFPYHPHVTVAQGIDDAALDEAYEGLAGFVARFHVDRFVLFCRESDGRWQWHSDFPLTPTH